MSRELSPRSSLDALRREARRWLNALRSGEPSAHARLRAALPEHTPPPGLRVVQQALAREHGFASWAALAQEIEERARTHADRVRLFLEKSVNRYGIDPATRRWGDYERDGPVRAALAARLLARHPALAADSLHTAVAAHDVEAVRRWLGRNPALAREASPFDGWPPLVRLAYARVPVEGVDGRALAIATLLLDAGADPDAGFPGSPELTVLVGVIGGGEHGQAAHPAAAALAQLLIARGADPFVPQALYNTSLGDDDPFWLDLLWAACEERGETHRWTGPAPDALGGGRIDSALAYLLGNAVPHHPQRVRWLLAHGADARGIHFYSREPVIRHAMLAGREDMAALLVQHGATPPVLSEEEVLVAAAVSGDLVRVRALAQAHPELLSGPAAMFAAIRAQRADMAGGLMDLGVSPDIADEHGLTALHVAVDCNAAQIARLLIARGAAIDARERRHGGTPLSRACYLGRAGMILLLASHSRHIRGLCMAGAVGRLRVLLAGEPDLVRLEERPGEGPLFALPGEDDQAVEVAELLLSFGAAPGGRNPAGQTPADVARRRGLEEAAALLEEAARRR